MGPVPWPRTGRSWSCQTGNIFREPEGLAEPRARLRGHNGPLCGGLAWTHPRAWPLGWGGSSFLICSQTQLPSNSSHAQRLGSQSSSRLMPTGLLPVPEFPPSAFLESACLNDLTQNEKVRLPRRSPRRAGVGLLLRPKGAQDRRQSPPGSGLTKIPG